MKVSALVLLSFLSFLFAHGALAFSPKSFKSGKVQLSVEQSREMILLFDQSCRSLRALPSVASRIEVENKSFQAHQIHAVRAISKGLTAIDLNQFESWPCLLGVAADQATKTVGVLGPDPREVEQTFRSPIGANAAERIFFHSKLGITKPVVIAVVDTGAHLAHPDLAPRIWQTTTGEVGFDFVNNDTDPEDDNGHGTHVTGLIAAQRLNSEGGRGIMGDYSRILSLKTQGIDGTGLMSNVVSAIIWAVDHGAEVINLSLTSRNANAALEAALEYAHDHYVTVVAAAGNEGEELSASNVIVPGSYAKDISGMISVGAIDSVSLLRSSFSNYGAAFVEIAAPGSNATGGILSTYLSGLYYSLQGTSMASPQVAGAAALAVGFFKTHGVNYTPALIEENIQAAADADPALAGSFKDGHRLNLRRFGKVLLHQTYLDSTGGFDEP